MKVKKNKSFYIQYILKNLELTGGRIITYYVHSGQKNGFKISEFHESAVLFNSKKMVSIYMYTQWSQIASPYLQGQNLLCRLITQEDMMFGGIFYVKKSHLPRPNMT